MKMHPYVHLPSFHFPLAIIKIQIHNQDSVHCGEGFISWEGPVANVQLYVHHVS